MVHEASCPDVGHVSDDVCRKGSLCAGRYAAESPRKGFVVSKLAENGNERTRKSGGMVPRPRRGQPVFEFFSIFVPHFRVGGTESGRGAVEPGGADVGTYTHQPPKRQRLRAQVAASLAERISLTRDTALFSSALCSMRRGYDLSFTLGSQIPKLPKSRGVIFNFQFGKTLRASSEAVVV